MVYPALSRRNRRVKSDSIDRSRDVLKKKKKEYQNYRGITRIGFLGRSNLRWSWEATRRYPRENVLFLYPRVTIEIMRGKMQGVPWSSISEARYYRRSLFCFYTSSIELRSSITRNIIPYRRIRERRFWLLYIIIDFPLKLYFTIYTVEENTPTCSN